MRMTQAKIHLSNLIGNLRSIKKLIRKKSNALISAAVKSNAYGHDIRIVTKSLLRAEVDSFVVANTHEALLLREFGVNLPIYLCSLPHPNEFPDLIAHSVIPMIDDIGLAQNLDKAARNAHKKIQVHMKIDTGMGRIGCLPKNALELRKKIEFCRHLEYSGTATHMSSADSNKKFTEEQCAIFRDTCDMIRQSGHSLGMIHIANSATTLQYTQSIKDISHMVRIGLMLYGYSPVADTTIPLKPVMELSSHIVSIKRMPKDSSISYGAEFKTKKETSIAIIPCGYGDGIPRILGNKGSVSIRGTRYPIVGRLCMDHLMVDIGSDPIPRYTPVTIFGPDQGAPTALDIARLCNTIPYEITCGISTTVPRIAV